MNMGILREFFHEFQATAKRFPTTNGSLGPHRKNRLLREFRGNGSCFSLLSRDKCNGRPASSVS
jgi:hypothetical protein